MKRRGGIGVGRLARGVDVERNGANNNGLGERPPTADDVVNVNNDVVGVRVFENGIGRRNKPSGYFHKRGGTRFERVVCILARVTDSAGAAFVVT